MLTQTVCVRSPGLSLSVAYRLNQTSSGSLQTELALAQNPLEVCSLCVCLCPIPLLVFVPSVVEVSLSTPTSTHLPFSGRPLSLLTPLLQSTLSNPHPMCVMHNDVGVHVLWVYFIVSYRILFLLKFLLEFYILIITLLLGKCVCLGFRSSLLVCLFCVVPGWDSRSWSSSASPRPDAGADVSGVQISHQQTGD